VTKGEYPYPEDEFDAVERNSVPRGVHRAPRSWWTRAWPFILVVILFPALAYGAVNYWTIERNATPAASASADDSASADTPTATSSATPSATSSATSSATPAATSSAAPDLAAHVVVFNATTRSGLAAAATKVLTAAGWTSVASQNYTGGKLATSTVLYGSAGLAPTAHAAADALGITKVTLDAKVTGLEIVLETDYKP